MVKRAARPGSGELRRLSNGVEPRLHATATKQLTAKAPGPRSKTGISTRVRAVVTAEPRGEIMPRSAIQKKVSNPTNIRLGFGRSKRFAP